MACVTALKRGLDLENYGHPYEHSPKRHCSSSRNSFSPKANNLNLESLSLDRNEKQQEGKKSPKPTTSYNSEHFPALSQIPSNKILEQVTSEARNLKRRRELPSQKGMKRLAPLTTPPSPESKSPRRQNGSSGRSEDGSDSDDSIESVNSRLYKRITAAATSQQTATASSSSSSSTSNRQSPKTCKSPEQTKKTAFSNPDQELRLTLRNVAKICESLLRQREDSIREEYDKILHEKLQEQYEIWCRYNQDQLSRHASSSSSNYIS